MKPSSSLARRAAQTSLVISLLLGACAEGTPPAPEAPAPQAARSAARPEGLLRPEELDALVCDAAGGAIRGAVEEVSPTAAALGITRYTYTLDPAEKTMRFQAWDAGGAMVGQVDVRLWQEEALQGGALVTLRDAGDNVLLTERGRARLEVGMGLRFEVEREVAGGRVRLMAQLTSVKDASRLVVSAPASSPDAPGVRPGPQGPEVALDLLAEDGTFTQSRDAVSAWAQEQGVAEALEGEAERLKSAILDDEGLRRYAYTHDLWCAMGEADRAVAREYSADAYAAEEALPGGQLETRADPLTCAQQENHRELTRRTAMTLDFISSHAGKLALDGPVEYIAGNSGDLGLKVTIDAGELGSVELTYGDIKTIQDYATALVLGPAAVVASPFGVALAGIAAGAYIAARVTETFGPGILDAWQTEREKEKPKSSGGSRRGNQGGLYTSSGTRKDAQSSGHPVIYTFDGGGYFFQGAGEFWLARSNDANPLAIQGRLEPVPGDRCPGGGAMFQAFVFVLDGHRIEVRGETREILIDGVWVSPEGSGFLLPGGGEVAFSRLVLEGTPYGERVFFRSSRGDILSVYYAAGGVHLQVSVAPGRLGHLEGMMGNADGDPYNDILLGPGNAPLPGDVDFYGDFANAWRIQTVEESLFTYAEGESPATYNLLSYPEVVLDPATIPEPGRSEAEATCREAGVEGASSLDRCVVDMYCLGGDDLLALHVFAPGPELDITPPLGDSVPDRATPVDYSGWSHFGPAERDGWSVSAEEDVVTYTSNGDPAAYISGRRYSSVVLEGFLNVPDAEGDDDVIGLVTGLDASDPERLEAVVIQWKGGEQPPAREGLVIARASIPFASFSEDQLWAQQETTGYTLLTASWGEGTGWREGQSVPFTLVVNPTRLTLRVQGFESGGQWVVDGAFPAGRVGFYDYSQPGAQWAYVTERQPIFEDDFISACELTATSYPGGEGSEHLVTCPPGCEPRIIWGTDVYVNDSSICTAAVHAGVITAAGGGAVRILKGADAGSYEASTRFGVTSEAYGEDDGSFTFVR